MEHSLYFLAEVPRLRVCVEVENVFLYVCVFVPEFTVPQYCLCVFSVCVSASILSSRCAVTVSLGNGHILPRPGSSQGSRHGSELRCQEGHFRDDNSPPAQTPGTFFAA